MTGDEEISGQQDGEEQQRREEMREEREEDDEEVTVVVSLQHVTQVPPDLTDIQLIEMDSQAPYIQVGGMVFEGRYKDTIGTHLLCTQTEETGGMYGCTETSEKELRCSKVVVVPRTEPS